MKFSEGKINPAKLEQGDWVDEIPEMGGLRLKVRGLNNADWRKMERKLIEAVPRKRRAAGRLEPDDQDAIQSNCLWNCCLMDWDGLVDDDGKPIPYSKEIAREICFLPENREYRNAVIWAATVVVQQSDSAKEDITKN